jgi:hypothetical protein
MAPSFKAAASDPSNDVSWVQALRSFRASLCVDLCSGHGDLVTQSDDHVSKETYLVPDENHSLWINTALKVESQNIRRVKKLGGMKWSGDPALMGVMINMCKTFFWKNECKITLKRHNNGKKILKRMSRIWTQVAGLLWATAVVFSFGSASSGSIETNSVALSPRANYTDWSTATCRWNFSANICG